MGPHSECSRGWSSTAHQGCSGQFRRNSSRSHHSECSRRPRSTAHQEGCRRCQGCSRYEHPECSQRPRNSGNQVCRSLQGPPGMKPVEVAEETPSVEVAVAEEVAEEVTAEVVAVCGLAYAWPRPP